MLRHVVRLFPTQSQYSSQAPSRLYLQQQRRQLVSETKQTHPTIGEIYDTLLNQTPHHPIHCNFVSQVVDHWAKQPNQVALRCMDEENNELVNITYAQLVERSHQLASFFRSQGLGLGDSVALMLGQRPTWWYGVAGLMRAGIALVPCPRLLTPKDLVYRIQGLGIRGFITTPELQSRIDVIRDECSTLTTCITTGASSKGWISTDDVFNGNTLFSQIETTTEYPCVYLYTSGTTGQPKAVQHNHDYPFFHWSTGRQWMRATPNDIVYNASDTGWGFTLWITTATWSMGSQLLITPTSKKFDAKKMLTTLSEQGVTIFCAAPTVLRLLVASSEFDRFQFPTLKRIVTVGEALDETVIERFAMRGIEVAVGFGQAETPLLMGRINDQPHVPGTMGQAIKPYKVVALDQTFKPLPPGNPGQIAVDLVEGKSAGIMRGYANASEKTKQSRSPDGRYYLTGDWATYRADGLFAYLGRKDDLIKSRGYRIGPDEVEKAGMSHSAVAKIAIVGVRTKMDSPAITVKAFILLKPGYTESSALIENIQTHIKEETGPYKYPRLVEILPLEEWEKYETTSGKIRRAGLREREEIKLTAAAHLAERSAVSTVKL